MHWLSKSRSALAGCVYSGYFLMALRRFNNQKMGVQNRGGNRFDLIRNRSVIIYSGGTDHVL